MSGYLPSKLFSFLQKDLNVEAAGLGEQVLARVVAVPTVGEGGPRWEATLLAEMGVGGSGSFQIFVEVIGEGDDDNAEEDEDVEADV